MIWAGLLVALAVVGAAGIRALRAPREAAETLPVLTSVPAFSLIERSGRRVTDADLRGQVWVVNFIFTRCSSLCPMLSAQMSRLQSHLREQGEAEVRLVSLSVDPEADTPSVLSEYAERFSADRERWWFLTGERAALYALIGDGLGVAVAQRPGDASSDPNELITHSDRFVLVDRASRIRGYYRGTDDEGFAQLLRDLRTLQREH
ncbi:MAG: SCO family protein [Deltaproteobacteria bacterium]|nr:SCO family protein [Deltaproteobacteria bacterium]